MTIRDCADKPREELPAGESGLSGGTTNTLADVESLFSQFKPRDGTLTPTSLPSSSTTTKTTTTDQGLATNDLQVLNPVDDENNPDEENNPTPVDLDLEGVNVDLIREITKPRGISTPEVYFVAISSCFPLIYLVTIPLMVFNIGWFSLLSIVNELMGIRFAWGIAEDFLFNRFIRKGKDAMGRVVDRRKKEKSIVLTMVYSIDGTFYAVQHNVRHNATEAESEMSEYNLLVLTSPPSAILKRMFRRRKESKLGNVVLTEVLSLVWLIVPILNGWYLLLSLTLLSRLFAMLFSYLLFPLIKARPLPSNALPPNFSR